MKSGRAIFISKFNTLIHEPIFVKNVFYAATIKNDNGSVAMKIFVWHKQKQNPVNFKKWRCKGIEDLLNCALTLSFFLIDEIAASCCVAQNETPKMANNVFFYQQVVAFFEEQAQYGS